MDAVISRKDLETWANFILNHSLGGITPEDVVMIKGEHITWPLMSVMQDKVFAAGAIADINITAPDNNRGRVWGASITKHGTIEQIQRVPQWHHLRYQAMTKYIEILGAENPSLFANLPEHESTALDIADNPFRSLRLQKNWVLTLFPTRAFADLEGMSLEQYTDILVRASTTDHNALGELEEPLAQLLEKSNTIRLVTQSPRDHRELELTMDISNRYAVRCTGNRNFPDGEVYTSPDANSVEGKIFIDLPIFYNGVTMQGIYLKLEKGIIVDYSAQKEPDTLKKIIETDPGSHRIGEVALGMNSGLQTALTHPMLVEKVGGTVHIAIGESYPECYIPDPSTPEAQKELELLTQQGIFNRSAQHVDIVADFRPGGVGRAVYLDDTRLTIKDNMWAIPE